MRNVGWVCPKCGRVYAPFVGECGHCMKQAYASELANKEKDRSECNCGGEHKCTCNEEKFAPTPAPAQLKETPTPATPVGGIRVKRYHNGELVEDKNFTYEDMMKEILSTKVEGANEDNEGEVDVVDEILQILGR